MFAALAVLVLAADPAPDWQQQESQYLKNIRQVTADYVRAGEGYFSPDGTGLKRLTDAAGYDAEGSYSPDGNQIVFCSRRDGHLELYVMQADGSHVRKLTNAPNCYNGGPFFSPDGKRVVFRSDRKEKDRLQLYVINTDGTGERCLTEKPNWVCWAPYWHPDGQHVIYTGADHGQPSRPNYDL